MTLAQLFELMAPEEKDDPRAAPFDVTSMMELDRLSKKGIA